MEARYRTDYDGEFVILESRWKNGVKEQTREWIPNPIQNHHISGRAAVIGSNNDLELFDYKLLQKHRGGLLGKKRLQTYAAGDLWNNMKFDFVVTNDKMQLGNIQEQQYNEENIVYTNARNCIAYPGNFYLTPYNPNFNQLALSVYLAAFDGHAEIFLIGYNNETPANSSEWQEEVNAVFSAYRLVEFILVGIESNMPAVWRKNQNVKCLTYQEFISYCDI